MDNYDVFFKKCKQALNNHKITFVKNRNLLINKIFEFPNEFSASSIILAIYKSTGTTIPFDVADSTISCLLDKTIIYPLGDETYTLISNFEKEEYKEEFINIETYNIENLEAYIVDQINNDINYAEKILDLLREKFDNLNEYYVYSIIDAYNLLIDSKKIDDSLKRYLEDAVFIDHNPTLILSLAKMLFHADEISVSENNIILTKEVSLLNDEKEEAVTEVVNQEPIIDVKKIIYQVLTKLKYDRLKPQDLAKINELASYQSYSNLYTLFQKAIDRAAIIIELPDERLEMNEVELEKYLES